MNEAGKYGFSVKGPARIDIRLYLGALRPGVDRYMALADHNDSGQAGVFTPAPGGLDALDRCGHEDGHADLRRQTTKPSQKRLPV